MQIRPTAFTIGLIIHFSIALFYVYTKYGIDSFKPLPYIVFITVFEFTEFFSQSLVFY